MATKTVVGTVVAVEINTDIQKADKSGSYKGTRITFKNSANGKIEEKCIVQTNFKFNAALLVSIEGLSPGDVFTMTLEENGKYWNVKSISKDDSSTTVSPQGTKAPAPKSTYETPEERAQRQVYTTRRSAISNAIDLLKTEKNIPSVEDILKVAKQFENYVMNTEIETFTAGVIANVPFSPEE